MRRLSHSNTITFWGTVLILSFLTISLFHSCNVKSTSQEKENKALVKNTFDKFWNNRDIKLAEEIYSPNYVWHVNGVKREKIGPEVVKDYINYLNEIFSNFKITTEDIIAKGDKVITRWTFKGNDKEYNKPFIAYGITIDKILDGKVVEGWSSWDLLGPNEKLGFTLTPPSANKK